MVYIPQGLTHLNLNKYILANPYYIRSQSVLPLPGPAGRESGSQRQITEGPRCSFSVLVQEDHTSLMQYAAALSRCEAADQQVGMEGVNGALSRGGNPCSACKLGFWLEYPQKAVVDR
jgi:hypothetical protein